MEFKIKRLRYQLKKKEEILNHLLTYHTSYVQLYDHQIRRVEDTMFNECEKLSQVKSAIENIDVRYKSYLILRMINRTSSEIIEILMLMIATAQGYYTRKCRKHDKMGDLWIGEEKFDIKIYWNKTDENGAMIHKSPRDYGQNKIIFDFNADKKREILSDFVGYFRDRYSFLWGVIEGIRYREYKTIRIHEMCYIQSTPWR